MVWCATMNTRYKLSHAEAVDDAVKLVRRTPATFAAYSLADYYRKTNEVLDGYRSDHRPVLLDVYPKRVR